MGLLKPKFLRARQFFNQVSCRLPFSQELGYMPTLGGLKKAQEFLALKGYSMPIFQMNIYEDGCPKGLRWVPGKGQTISLDKAIRAYSAMHEVADVRLVNKQGDKFVQFSCFSRCGLEMVEDNRFAILEFHKGDPVDYEFEDFMNSNNGKMLLTIARWGKDEISILDGIKFDFFPKRYAKEVFA